MIEVVVFSFLMRQFGPSSHCEVRLQCLCCPSSFCFCCVSSNVYFREGEVQGVVGDPLVPEFAFIFNVEDVFLSAVDGP